MKRQIANGGEMISRAAVNSIYSLMMKYMQSQGKVAIGASDKISANSISGGYSCPLPTQCHSIKQKINH